MTSTYRDFPMPPPLVDSARTWLDRQQRGVGEPDVELVPARRSATVMLLRGPDGGAGVEVFVLRRAATMAFAPGNVAFPGGGVDHRDAEVDVPWAGPTLAQWAQVLDRDEATAQELVVAAAREVFEEAGVLLAGTADGDVIGEPASALPGVDVAQARQALINRRYSFGQFLAEHDLVLRSDLMRPRAWWTTPECEPRRFDTLFFAAALPAGQQADGRSTEAAHTAWVRPHLAIADYDAGREIMLPPTLVMLEQLAGARGVDQVLAEHPAIRQVMPWPAEHSGRLWMRAPLGSNGHGLPESTTQPGGS